MITIFEFLGDDPLDNVITCMNFRSEKCVFFGYREEIARQKKSTEKFLKKYCHVEEVLFIEVPRYDLYGTGNAIRMQIEKEGRLGSRIYFDLTGGEELALVAFGMLAREINAPMHAYDVINGRLIDYDGDQPFGISHSRREQYVRMDLDRFIELRGGVINYSLHNKSKDLSDPEFNEDVRKMWSVVEKHRDHWTSFCAFVRENMIPEKGLLVERKEKTIQDALDKEQSELKTKYKLDQILSDLSDAGVLTEYDTSDAVYHFRFKNDMIKDCLWDGGILLELHTFDRERSLSDDCMMGVHLDWDGVLNVNAGSDVYNEIDVLSLTGYVPTFISCKNGRMSGSASLHALYELSIVADRFGGKYAKKVLVSTQPIGDVYKKRAREMGIEIR